MEKYAKFYNYRKKASTMTQAAIDWLKNHVEKLSCISKDKTFSLLSIGCGDGDIDLQLIDDLSKILLKRNQNLEYVAFEPNPFHYQIIKNELKTFLLKKMLQLIFVRQVFARQMELHVTIYLI
ncbi:MAG: hypothetical protein OMM_08351 [Candidatus Magnetoglobus multicellularis str. Araruama]|uniref:Methyltransferase domain-containing protein n=1 Tax=Candidatus Magnetoglobus multicellularis str. Araruama TaxID=890399 RepID=A0A1V1P864_9BACT|nr:MAG: hypothetical protein OMM_08351 [Candidatus Magnetoglobus multicellularis str. Araruama]